MAITTFKEYLSGGVESKATTSKTLSFAEYIANAEPSKPTLGSKAGNIAKALAVGIAKPVVTSVARPIQLGAELLGATAEQVDRVSAKVPGGLVAPVPRNFQDVKKDVGRGIETAALALPVSKLSSLGRVAPFVPKSTTGQLIAGGAGFGLGASLEEGNKLFSKETAISTGLGGITGGILGVAGKTYRSFKDFQKTPAQYTEEALKRADFGPIPQAPQRALTTVPGRGVVDKTPIALPEAGVLKGQQALRDVPQVTPPVKSSTPQQTRAKATASRDDFVASETKAAEKAAAPKFKPTPKEVIRVNDKDFVVSKQDYTKYIKEKQVHDDYVKALQDSVKKGGPQADVASKRLKAEGFEFAAKKRAITGDFTATELSNLIKRELSNYIGKSVTVAGSKGVIASKPSFGNFKVKFKNGKTSSIPASKIKDPRTLAEIKRGITSKRAEHIPERIKSTAPAPRKQTTEQIAKIWDEQHATPKALPQKKAVVKPTKTTKKPEKKPETKTEPKKEPVTPKKAKYKTTKDESKVLEEAAESADKVVEKTTIKKQKDLYNKAADRYSVDELSDIVYNKKKLPDDLKDLDRATIYELTRNRKDLTPEQVIRLANELTRSEAGLSLRLSQLRDGFITNPADYVAVLHAKLRETAVKGGITKKTVDKLLKIIECP